MQGELAEDGHDVAFVAINRTDALDYQKDLAVMCSYPLLQDSEALGIFGQMDAAKDDIYVYDVDGKLVIHLPVNGAVNINMSYREGYENVKGIALALALASGT